MKIEYTDTVYVEKEVGLNPCSNGMKIEWLNWYIQPPFNLS